VPKDLATICLKAMDKEPHRRYPSMAELADDLRRYLRGEAIRAKPVGPIRRILRWMKRNPVLSAVSFLAILSVLGSLFFVLWSYPVILSERDKAQRAREDLSKESRKANALNRFLMDMFKSPKPDEKGRDVKVADMLDLASEKAGETLADEPGLEVKLRYTLGRSYYGLGLYEEAGEQYQRALSIAESLFDEEHPDRLALTGHLATTLWALGKYEESEALHRKVIAVQERILGKEHPDTLRSKTNLATTLNDQGKLAEAAELLIQVVQARERTQGEESPDTLNALNNLAISLMDRGLNAEAENILRTTLPILERTLGKEHPDAIGARVNLT
jgi:tetratricopeptide (TPR) repeat protein